MSAKVMDYEGIKSLVRKADERFARLRQLWLDALASAQRARTRTGSRRPWGGRCGSRRAPQRKPPPEGVLMRWAGEWAKEGVALDWRKLLPLRASKCYLVGGGADDGLDRPQQEDEQRLRETMCQRRSVGVRCDDSPHDEAARPCLRTFHTASGRNSED